MKLWKAFALASIALNLGIIVAVGLVWLRGDQEDEYDQWLSELELTDAQTETLFTLVDRRFETADLFFDQLDSKFDTFVMALEAEQPDATDIRRQLNRVEWERGQLSRQMNADLVDFLLTLEPEQRVETLFFMLEAEDLALWFF